MATFVQGVAPLSPKPVVFDLDFAYMERMLKMRQNMYNSGASKVKNLYESLFTSNMLRDDNIAKRDSYLKTISGNLKAISGLDFSLSQNVQNAMTLFEPITNDQYVARDIAYTKNYSSELSKAQSYKSSTDGEQRKQWWQEGIKALQYQAEEFKNAPKEQTLSMSAPKYVPNVDLKAMADKMWSDGKISVKQDVIKGGYIWTMKNGEIAYPISQSIVSTMFSQDPAIKEAFRTQAYVARKDYIKQHAAEFGGDESKAEQAYMENVVKNTINKNRVQLYAEDDEVSKIAEEVNSWRKLEEDGKILKGSDAEKKYKAAVEKLKVAGDALAQRKIEMNIQEINDLGDIESMRAAVDGAVTMDSYNTIAQQIAKYLAEKNKEVTVKVDPAYLADIRAQNAMELEALREQNREILESLRQTGRIATEQEKQTGRIETEQEKQKGRKEIQDMKNKKKSVNVTGGGKQDATKISDLWSKSVSPYTASPDSGTSTSVVPPYAPTNTNTQTTTQTTTAPTTTSGTTQSSSVTPQPRPKTVD